MSKAVGITLLIIGVLFVGGCSVVSWAIGTNNNIVTLEVDVNSKWAQVQNQYQRRADLIPNLVETVRAAGFQEKSTLEAVIQARASATQVKIDPSSMTPEQLKQFQSAQTSLGGTLSRLLVSIERYPELKTNKNFRDLQSQLEGTENRIAVERKRFNESTQAYNTAIGVFPGSMVASFRGFTKKPFFEAEEAAKAVPKVDFGLTPKDKK